MLLNLTASDPLVSWIQWASIAFILGLPWLLTHSNFTAFRRSCWFIWMASVATLSALYLGFLTYNYNGVQLGFNHEGNPMNALMILVGLCSTLPFMRQAYLNGLLHPLRTATLVSIAVLLLIGPALLNSVALYAYQQGGGGFDGGQGDYAGEDHQPEDPIAWFQAEVMGFLSSIGITFFVFYALFHFGHRKDRIEPQSDLH